MCRFLRKKRHNYWKRTIQLRCMRSNLFCFIASKMIKFPNSEFSKDFLFVESDKSVFLKETVAVANQYEQIGEEIAKKCVQPFQPVFEKSIVS